MIIARLQQEANCPHCHRQSDEVSIHVGPDSIRSSFFSIEIFTPYENIFTLHSLQLLCERFHRCFEHGSE